MLDFGFKRLIKDFWRVRPKPKTLYLSEKYIAMEMLCWCWLPSLLKNLLVKV